MRSAYVIVILALAACCYAAAAAAEAAIGVEAPAAGSRYLMQERYPQPGKGAPSVANVTTAVKEAVQAAEPKRSSAGTLTGSALLAVAAAAAAVFAL